MSYTKLDVQKLMQDVAHIKAARQAAHAAAVAKAALDKVPVPENDVALAGMDAISEDWELSQFDLALDVRDAVSGKIFVVCRPEREGQAEVMLTADAIDALLQDAHKTVLAARQKAAAEALAAAKVKADQAAKDKEAAAEKAKAEADAAAAAAPATVAA